MSTKLNSVEPKSGVEKQNGSIELVEGIRQTQPDAPPPTKTRAGKEPYKFVKSYRKANTCQKFFYTYGNLVVETVYRNNGVLKYEAIEDIKLDENETTRMVNTFSGYL